MQPLPPTANTLPILSNCAPNAAEMTEAVRFVLSIDSTEMRKDDLWIVLEDLEFDFHDIHDEIERRNKEGC